MKAKTLLKIVGFGMITVGITLIVLACTVWAFDDEWFGQTPQFGALVPGAFLCFAGLIAVIAGFVMNLTPQISEFGQKVGNDISNSARNVAESFSGQPRRTNCAGCGAGITKTSNTGRFCEFCGTRL